MSQATFGPKALSDDEIQFGDVTYREPQRLLRPDLDRRYACVAYEVPQPVDLPIFLDRAPADAIERHALRDTSVELGGILLGRECVDEATGNPFVWITQALEAKHYENTQASFTYTHDSWEEITRERDLRFPDLDIVGWYHTHPDFGIFLSSHDLFIHNHFFNQMLQVAYVVDPIRQTRGFFQWRDGQMVAVGGFYIVGNRTDRVSVARLASELEGLPGSDGGGSGLSPRLEAELIAMLSRPQYAQAAPNPQSAAFFGVIGLLLGALVMAGVFWVWLLFRGMVDQNDRFEKLLVSQEKSSSDQRKLLDAERLATKELALDELTRELRVGSPPDRFVAKYEEAVLAREEALKRIQDLEREKEGLGLVVGKRQEETNEAQALLSSVRRKQDERETEIQTLEKKNKEMQTKLDDAARLVEDSKAGVLDRKYTYAWYAALGGWIAFVACAIGLATIIARMPAHEEESDRELPPQTPTSTISIT